MNRPQVAYIDGPRLKRSIIAGTNRLERMAAHLDNINVFPVPDHDTGTNMTRTMRSVADDLRHARCASSAEIARRAADTALLNAQGNSGAIIAQFFEGLAEGCAGCKRLDTRRFSEVVMLAAQFAREAVSLPREGTVLTVCRAWAEAAARASESTDDFIPVLEKAYAAACNALTHTEQQLDDLRRAHVVDAGAQGFLYLLDGILDFIRNGRLDRDVETPAGEVPSQLPSDSPEQPGKHRYCTECVINGRQIDKAAVRHALASLGDSLVVAGSRDLVRIHVHTNDPSMVIHSLERFGSAERQKVDDMRQQLEDSSWADDPRPTALVTDSTCDLPASLMERHRIHVVPLRVIFGNRAYLDKSTLTPAQFYERLRIDPHHPKTSQPTPADFVRTYEFLLKHYRSVVSIHISAKLSGTVQSARRAAENLGADITVVDSTSASIGLGLVVLAAAEALASGADASSVARRARETADAVHVYLCPRTIAYLVKGGRIGRVSGAIGRILGVTPIFELYRTGELRVVRKLYRGMHIRNTFAGLMSDGLRRAADRRVLVAGSDDPELAQWLRSTARSARPDADIMVENISPVIGTHVGPGTAGVAFVDS